MRPGPPITDTATVGKQVVVDAPIEHAFRCSPAGSRGMRGLPHAWPPGGDPGEQPAERLVTLHRQLMSQKGTTAVDVLTQIVIGRPRCRRCQPDPG